MYTKVPYLSIKALVVEDSARLQLLTELTSFISLQYMFKAVTIIRMNAINVKLKAFKQTRFIYTNE